MINRLSARSVETKSTPGYYSDGAGLYLQVSAAPAHRPNEGAGGRVTKSWIYRFSLNKRAREMGLGPAHIVTLAEARKKAIECRKLLLAGKDPISERNASRARFRTQAASSMSFDQCAAAYVQAHRDGWRSAKHAAQWESTLRAFASPVIGALPVSEVQLQQVLRVLEPIWRVKTETATRVRGRIESVLDWATVRGYRQGENPARWRGHLDKLLPARSRVATTEHHAAVPILAMPDFMRALRSQSGIGARALEFAILTVARSGEVRGATWSEIDLGLAVWTIPAQRMKAGREHRVPLSGAAVLLLRSLRDRIEGFDLVFLSPRCGQLSDMTLTAVMRRMKVSAVPHGFRSTFRDWCSECTDYPREAAEMALAHAIGDKVEAAYRRGDLFEKRRRLMEAWAQFCAGVNLRPLDATLRDASAESSTATTPSAVWGHR